MLTRQSLVVLGGSTLALLVFVFLGIRHYDGNVSGLLHMDVPFGEQHDVPSGLVLYKDAAYDGMLYYQVARDIPALFSGEKTSLDSPYRFQRILLPLLVYVTTLGNESIFPWAFLLINLITAIATLALMMRMTKKGLHALAVVFNPAVLIGILYTLTEPVSIFFIVLFFYVWKKNNQRLNVLTIIALVLSLLARETTVFLIAPLFVWFLWKKQWRDAVLVLIPIILLILWQYFLVLRLGDVAFQANSNTVSIPFSGPLTLIKWLTEGITSYRLSSLGLLLFVIPLCIALGREWIMEKTKISVLAFLLSGLVATMFIMDAHMWGAITSIGRVVTPLYPVYALWAAERDTWVEQSISIILIAVSIVAAIGIASVPHPFMVS